MSQAGSSATAFPCAGLIHQQHKLCSHQHELQISRLSKSRPQPRSSGNSDCRRGVRCPRGLALSSLEAPKNKTTSGWRSTRKGNVMQGKIRTDASFSCWAAWGLLSTGHPGPCQHCMFPCHSPYQCSFLHRAGDAELPSPSGLVYSEPRSCPPTQPQLPPLPSQH